ncbi:MAG TPA: PilZ domain-containing protein [Nitrospira sp.]|nr:PilZ domain-containing protein [Nitrospira sp.]
MHERKHVRFAIQRPVTFQGDTLSGNGTILNISREGCAITSEIAAGTESYVQLKMQLQEKEEPIQVDLAAIRWSSAAKFGVEFIKMHPEAGVRLQQFVKLLE